MRQIAEGGKPFSAKENTELGKREQTVICNDCKGFYCVTGIATHQNKCGEKDNVTDTWKVYADMPASIDPPAFDKHVMLKLWDDSWQNML